MAKFKVGDMVKVLGLSKIKRIEDFTGGLIAEVTLKRYIGKTFVISSLCHYPDGRTGYRFKDGAHYVWDERALERVYNTVIIYQKDDKTVIALDKVTGETAEARCNPIDEFDFCTGAKLALDRLLNSTIRVDDKDSTIRVGDRVSIIGTGKMYTTNTEWIIEHIDDKELLCRYAYGDSLGYHDGVYIVEDKEFIVLYINGGRAFIKGNGGRCYLIGLDGLKKLY